VSINYFITKLKTMETIIESKVCKRCKENKSLKDYHIERKKKDGLKPWCAACQCEITRNWRLRNLEHKTQYNKQWFKDNPTYNYAYVKNRINTDPQFRAVRALRKQAARICNMLGKLKDKSTEEIIGMNLSDGVDILLKNMIKAGYTMEQFLGSKLALDHKIPLSWVDLTNEQEFKAAGHVSNLQLILRKENANKSDKYAHMPDNSIMYKEEWKKSNLTMSIIHERKMNGYYGNVERD
jgi:hypothetical protein